MTQSKNNFGPILIIGILFFVFGFVTWLNATLIPYLRMACELTKTQAMLVTFAFYIAYFVMALPSSAILKKVGFKNGMGLGLLVMAGGALIFIPAANSRDFTLFLLGLFVQGTGLSLLQTASNPYVTILGPIESAAKRISIMGIANKIAGILSPIILGAVVLKGADALKEKLAHMESAAKAAELDLMAEKVILPYLVMAGVLVLLSVWISKSKLPEVEAAEEEGEQGTDSRSSIFQFPYLWLGVATLFFYVGVEVIAVDTLIQYGEFLGFPLKEAKFFSSITLAAMIFGYVVGIVAIPKFLTQSTALKICAGLGVVFSALAIATSGFTSILCIALLGLANSLMWPAIWPLAIDGLGKFTKMASAFLVMAISGGALLPMLYGKIAEVANDQFAYIIMIPCYLFILFFAVKGHKIGKHAVKVCPAGKE
ncbi:MAG: sugar MFS transporter [Marinifilaceae bacterium]